MRDCVDDIEERRLIHDLTRARAFCHVGGTLHIASATPWETASVCRRDSTEPGHDVGASQHEADTALKMLNCFAVTSETDERRRKSHSHRDKLFYCRFFHAVFISLGYRWVSVAQLCVLMFASCVPVCNCNGQFACSTLFASCVAECENPVSVSPYLLRFASFWNSPCGFAFTRSVRLKS